MLNAAGSVALLDRRLADVGQNIILRRLSQALDITVRAVVRGYLPEELSGGLLQGDTKVTISPTSLKSTAWIGLPKRLDKLVIDGRVRNVEFVDPVSIGADVVRISMQVRG